jgi:ribonucleoside-diphosphate reductase alpha chain
VNERKGLPQRRHCETFDMQYGDLRGKFSVSIGRYPDDTIGEVFISGLKAGSELDSVTRDGAILLSLCLQHGVSMELIQRALTRNLDGGPSTIIGAVVDRIIE